MRTDRWEMDGGGGTEVVLATELRDSLRELNRRFLEWVALPSCGWDAASRVQQLDPDFLAGIAALSPDQRSAAADCPYALFNLRFEDDVHWRERLLVGEPMRVADADAVDPTREFVRLALFFAWHVASRGGHIAHLLLGMHRATAATFRELTIDRLPALAFTEAQSLTARWSERHGYWNALARAASGPNVGKLRRIQLYGLQLTAAAHFV